MGKQTLMLCCRLENVDNLRLPSDMDWHFILQCSQCGEKTDNEIYFNPIEELDIEGSKGKANYIAKCKFCERKASISFLSTHSYLMSKNEDPQPIAVFECRGWDIVEFVPKGGYICESTQSETVFKDIDLSELDWAEYDDDGDCAVGIYDVKATIK